MKTCLDCKQLKPLTEYYKHKYASDGLQRYCKPCANIRSAKSELKNKDKYHKIRKNVKVKFRDEMREYKASKGCNHCGENHPAVLDLHHLDPNVKDLNPSDATSRKLFYEEADKCIVLCSNCHRKLHYSGSSSIW